MPLCVSLSTFPAHASLHFTVNSVHASAQFTVCFPCACSHGLHSVLALRMPLCISLSTFFAHASVRFTVYFPVCLYAFHCALSLCIPLYISLCTCPARASMRFTALFIYACFSAFHCLLSETAAGAAGTYFAYYFLYLEAATLQLDPCGRSSADHEDMRRFTRRRSESDPTRTIPAEGRALTARIATKISFCDRDDPRRGAGMLKIKKPSVCAQSALGPTARRP